MKNLRLKIIEELEEQVPDSLSFPLGYFEGQKHSKIWLVTEKDLQAMYEKYPLGEITLWCDRRVSPVTGNARKKDEPGNTSRRQEKEDEVDKVYKELKEKHGSKYATPLLRLWARMVNTKLHDDLDSPPNIPAFTGTPAKRTRQQDSLSDVVKEAAAAVAKAFKPDATQLPTESRAAVAVSPGVSPVKATDLRTKSLEQLRSLKQLLDDGVLSDQEYLELKQDILTALRNLK